MVPRPSLPLRAVALTLLLLVPLGAGCDGGADSTAPSGDLILATTTSVQDSGLLDRLVPLFEARTGVNVKAVAVGTGAALRMAQEGNADALFVHAPDAERALLAAGDVINRHLIMFNDFIIAGPPDDPAAIAGKPDVETALARIESSRSRFVSRGDDSGTHKKELALWEGAGVEPGGSWYAETGQGMGPTLTIADQRRAYVLVDRATFLAFHGKIDLIPLAQGDPALLNFYSVMQVNPSKGRINARAAEAWVAFTRSGEVQDLIERFRVAELGARLFFAARDRSEDEVRAAAGERGAEGGPDGPDLERAEGGG